MLTTWTVTFTLQLGGCDGKAANCLPIAHGWKFGILETARTPEPH